MSIEKHGMSSSSSMNEVGVVHIKVSHHDAEEAVQLICETGGVVVLAHPLALKTPAAVIRKLQEGGFYGLEVYRSVVKFAAFNGLADAYDLLKLGGSDYHARGGSSESALRSTMLKMTTRTFSPYSILQLATFSCQLHQTVYLILNHVADDGTYTKTSQAH